MSTSNTGNNFDRVDIAGTEQVKESYRAALQEEPRAIIDDAIRAAARRAVSSGPSSIGKTWFNRWTTPLAAAATVMLTSSVIFMAVRDRPEVAPPIADMVAASDKNKVVISEAAKDVGVLAPVLESDAAEKRAYAPAPASANTAQTLQLNQAKEKKLSVGEPMVAPTMTRMQDSSNRAMQTPPAPLEVIVSQQKIPSPSPKPTAPFPEMAKAPPFAAPVATPSAPSTASRKVLNEIKAEVTSDLGVQDTSRKKQSDREATAALTAQATGKVVPPPVVAAPAPAPPPAADNMEKSPAFSQRAIAGVSEKSDRIESADAWVKRMTELKRQEKSKELADEMVRFRKRYPNVELPQELTQAQN